MTKKIMFVCLGNICRSPLADAVMNHQVKERGQADVYHIDSSGTSAYHIGEQADGRMRRTAHQHGICIDHRAQQLIVDHMSEFDYVFAMDFQNLQDILSITPDKHTSKVALFRDYDPEGEGDVPDPYYGGVAGFEEVYAIVDRTCAAILDNMEAGKL